MADSKATIWPTYDTARAAKNKAIRSWADTGGDIECENLWSILRLMAAR